MVYADIHTHILYGADDGPQNRAGMERLIDAVYEDGARVLCATPHMRPELWGDPSKAVRAAWVQCEAFVMENYPDLRLALGSEIYYHPNFSEWIRDGRCVSLNGGSAVLLEFSTGIREEELSDACRRVLQKGYKPVLAHVERYSRIRGKLRLIEQLKDSGCFIQLNALSLLSGAPFGERRACRKLLQHRLADLIASDCHDPLRRPPGLSEAGRQVVREYGEAYAEEIFWQRPCEILFGTKAEEK